MQLQCLPPTEQGKAEVKAMLEKVRQDVRLISHELMPPQFQRVTLKEVVEDYAGRILAAQPAEWALAVDDGGCDWSRVPEDQAYEVYRILQELLSNVLKHAEATRIDLRLCLSKKDLVLQIAYCGKPCPSHAGKGNGIGLTTVSERAKSIGAAFTVAAENGEQRMTLNVPLAV